MRIPPGLAPKLVTSTSDAADARGGDKTPAMAISRVLASVTSAVLIIVDLRSATPSCPKICISTTTVNDLPNIGSRFLGALHISRKFHSGSWTCALLVVNRVANIVG